MVKLAKSAYADASHHRRCSNQRTSESVDAIRNMSASAYGRASAAWNATPAETANTMQARRAVSLSTSLLPRRYRRMVATPAAKTDGILRTISLLPPNIRASHARRKYGTDPLWY